MMRNIPLPLVLVVITCSDCFILLNAQWILDNRCRRRLDEAPVSFLSDSIIKQSTLEDDLVDVKDTILEKADNSTNEKEEDYLHSGLRGISVSTRNTQGHWYNGLLGRPLSDRNLLEEDPSSFMMLMHWQPGNCWQGEWLERRYCMECEGGDECWPGNKLWTKFCDNSAGQKFVWVPNLSKEYSAENTGANYGQLKLAYFDLCLERMTTNTFQVQRCDVDSPYQVLVGWHPTEPFELHPVENSIKCINQHHHPRPEEEIANTSCDTARQHHTNLWKVYQNNNAGNEIVRMRRPECSRYAPCGKCEGDCDTSEDCEGDLICVQRLEVDGPMPVPGCSGIPNAGADYCASPEDLFVPPIPNHSLRIRQPSCTSNAPCLQCEGDCDSDRDCKGSMKCFQRNKQNADEKVPNCEGEEVAAANVDYCYEPDEALSLQAPVYLQTRPLDCGRRGKVCMQCQGDCDKDEDCFGPLKCFQRKDYTAVPGCEGRGIAEADYCYLPDGFSFPTSPPTPVPTKAPKPVDNEGEVEENNSQQNDNDTTNQMRLDSNELTTCSSESPCKICRGDCDTDNDCEENLACFQRPFHKPYKKVPGCIGRGVPGADYCVKP